MTGDGAHIRYVEPLRKAVQEALDAAGMTAAEAAKLTGQSSQYISQVLNRKDRYTRPPTIKKMQALAKIPGLSIEDIVRAVSLSLGYPIQASITDEARTGIRLSVHNVVDEFEEEHLSGVLQVLLALRQLLNNRRNRSKG